MSEKQILKEAFLFCFNGSARLKELECELDRLEQDLTSIGLFLKGMCDSCSDKDINEENKKRIGFLNE